MPPTDGAQADFFISYSSPDKDWAEWTAWQLEEAGYGVIIQAWDFRPGTNFVEGMQRAVTSARRTIAILSPDYLNSTFTQSEWQSAFAADPTGVQGLLIPIRVRECSTEGILRTVVYIDFVDHDER